MSNIFDRPKKDLADCRGIIASLNDWKSKNWAIGMTYSGSHQPDGFFTFFAVRNLSFECYLRAPDLSTGGPEAYDRNIDSLLKYAKGVYNDEIKAVNGTIATIKDWQSKNWAIGLTYNSCQPDGFARFLSTRGLPTAYYVRGACSYGDPTAYDAMIDTLNQYKDSLWNPATCAAPVAAGV